MQQLQQSRVLVLEDQYLLAMQVEEDLQSKGAQVVGPVATASEALELIESTEIDAAVLNVRLKNGTSFAVADELLRRGVPFVFVTAFEQQMLPETYVSIPHLTKPLKPTELVTALLALVSANAER
ncbi:hypothetical protein SLNSH_22725 [Alsobacter soli]|uniref:Response regulatory domain-containing protein n=1 Tax=Alsobacter soli TaxID=2109933 RepID=A0A2T1HLZ8_9HYPH|nr:response regulator [Alsobacter soli]PSC02680.1 hypothetical protein SLNSH_22725 [Alsobacter soli]